MWNIKNIEINLFASIYLLHSEVLMKIRGFKSTREQILTVVGNNEFKL